MVGSRGVLSGPGRFRLMRFREIFAQLKANRPLPSTLVEKSICFVSATRRPEDEFWRESALGISLANVIKLPGVSAKITFVNSRGLPAIYNECINEAMADILVFLHDDVWFYDDALIEKIRSAHEAFDIVGVAGNKRRVPNQPSWMFRAYTNGELIMDRHFLSGAVGNGDPDQFTIENYGSSPAECELLDGVFISTLAKKLKRNKVTFDDRFDFHCYDIDFCRTARLQKMTLGTWPIQLIHQSPGAFGPEEWKGNLAKYLSKWKS